MKVIKKRNRHEGVKENYEQWKEIRVEKIPFIW